MHIDSEDDRTNGFRERFSILCKKAGTPVGFGEVKFLADLLSVTPKTASLWLRGIVIPKPKILRRSVVILLKTSGIDANIDDVVEWLISGTGDVSTQFNSAETISLSHEKKLTIYIAVTDIAKTMGIDDLTAAVEHNSLEQFFDKVFKFAKDEFNEGNVDYLQSEDFTTLVKAAIWMAQREMF